MFFFPVNGIFGGISVYNKKRSFLFLPWNWSYDVWLGPKQWHPKEKEVWLWQEEVRGGDGWTSRDILPWCRFGELESDRYPWWGDFVPKNDTKREIYDIGLMELPSEIVIFFWGGMNTQLVRCILHLYSCKL